MASPTKELTASDLISQATKISELVNGNWKNTVKTEISRKMEKQGDAAFVYWVSSLWLEQWKEMSGFDEISEGIEVNAGKLDLTKRLPKLNEDIVDDSLSKNIVRLGKFNPKLEFLDVVLKKGITEEIHFMYVTEEMWTCFKVWYSDAIEVKRKVYVNSHHEISYEVHCHLVTRE